MLRINLEQASSNEMSSHHDRSKWSSITWSSRKQSLHQLQLICTFLVSGETLWFATQWQLFGWPFCVSKTKTWAQWRPWAMTQYWQWNNKRYNEIMDERKCLIDKLEFEAILSNSGYGPDTGCHVSEIKRACVHLSVLWAQFTPANHQCENLLNMWRQEIMLATRVLHATRHSVMLAVAKYIDELELQPPFRPFR